ncbi:MAG TPA: hypothetical protein P5056_02425 [Candidatus Paceibacterota bacterium]|nr:hypothetical protein [Candidatus Paceibacterota bacterium]
MSKFEQRIRAKKLRTEGMSLGDIAKNLGVSKGTVGLWCRDIILTKEQESLLKQKVIRLGLTGRMKGAEMNKKSKESRIELAKKDSEDRLSKLSEKDLFVCGLSLYWAKGSKSPSSRFCFTNSDPAMIKIFLNFLYKIYNVQKKAIMPKIAINETHRDREKIVLKYWSNLLGIPLGQFRNTSFNKTKIKKIYDNHDKYFGTMSIRVEKSNQLWYKILTSIDIIKNRMPA